jgi:hypothetical protein
MVFLSESKVVNLSVAIILAVTASVLVIAIFPLGGAQWQMAGARFFVNEGSTLTGGSALVGIDGLATTPLARWRWCPGRGPSAFCLQLAGAWRGDGVVALGARGLTVKQLSIESAGLTMPLADRVLATEIAAGQVRQWPIAYRDGCPRGLDVQSQISLTLHDVRWGNQLLGDATLRTVPVESDGLIGTAITGERINGTMRLDRSGTLTTTVGIDGDSLAFTQSTTCGSGA